MVYLSYAEFPQKFLALPSKWLIHSITTSLEQHDLSDSTDSTKGESTKKYCALNIDSFIISASIHVKLYEQNTIKQ